MKKRGMVVASIAGIAGLAIGVGSLLSGSTGDSGDTSSFVVQQVGGGGGNPSISGNSQGGGGGNPSISGNSQGGGGGNPSISGNSQGSGGGYLYCSDNQCKQYNFFISNAKSCYKIGEICDGDPEPLFCGNGRVEGNEQCEGTGKCQFLITFSGGGTASMNGACNPKTCMCEQKTCSNALDITPSSNILQHDAGNGNFGGTYRLKPGSSTFDCKWESNHIFIRGLINDPKEYYLQPLFNSSLYCGASTGGCFFIVKTLSGTVFTGNSGCANLGVAKNAGISFVPGVRSNDPSYGGKITVKNPASYKIDCSKATRDGYTPNKARIDNRKSRYLPPSRMVPLFNDKENPAKRLDCLTVGDDWAHATCWYDVEFGK